MRIQYAPPSAQQPQPRPAAPSPARPAAAAAQPDEAADIVVTVQVEPGGAAPAVAALRLVAASRVVPDEPVARLVRWHTDGSAEERAVIVSVEPGAPVPAEVAAAAARVSVHDLSSCELGAVSVGRRPDELLAVSVGAPVDEIAVHGADGLAVARRTVVEVRLSFAPGVPPACWTALGVAALATREGK